MKPKTFNFTEEMIQLLEAGKKLNDVDATKYLYLTLKFCDKKKLVTESKVIEKK